METREIGGKQHRMAIPLFNFSMLLYISYICLKTSLVPKWDSQTIANVVNNSYVL